MSEEKEDQDVIFVGPPDGGGGHMAVRCRGGRPVDVGSIRELEHGKTIMGEPMRLRLREEGNGYDVEYLIQGPARSGGPAKVNSQAFRNNWGTVFGSGSLFGSKVRPGSA